MMLEELVQELIMILILYKQYICIHINNLQILRLISI